MKRCDMISVTTLRNKVVFFYIFVFSVILYIIWIRNKTILTSDTFFHKQHFFRNESTHVPRVIVWYNYTTVGKEQFFIFSAIASKSAQARNWDLIVITGWEPHDFDKKHYKCCLYTENGMISSESAGKRAFPIRAKGIEARQVLCRFPEGVRPYKVNLKLLEENCTERAIGDVVAYPEPQSDDKIAVCGKIIYGKKHPVHLIEWIEFHRFFGASLIVVYVYQDLNSEAWSVLRYYLQTMENSFQVILMPRIPGLEKWPRHFATRGTMELLNDEQVQIYDTVERFREYRYLAIIDSDEFIAPNTTIAKNYLELMKYLTTTYPKAGTFQLMTQLYITSWGKTDPASDLLITQYSNRSESVKDRMKLIHVKDRVVPETIWIHDGSPKRGYIKVLAKDTEVVLKHYRKCRDEWLTNQTTSSCFGRFRVQYDSYMTKVAREIDPHIRKTRDALGL